MSVDYRKQYRPEHLEPFWPNEIMKMATAVLTTLAVIMIFAILPVVLDVLGLHDLVHAEEPADPYGTTPVGIKPEWYFLASYQYLKLMPTALFGVSGKTLGVVTQGVVLVVILLVPFWYRRRADARPGWAYRIGVSAVLLAVLALTVWGGWPAEHGVGGERLLSLRAYVGRTPLFFIVVAAGLLAFYGLIAHERRTIRRTLDAPVPGLPQGREPSEGDPS